MKKSTIFPWKVLETGSKSDSESQPSISSSKDDANSTPKKLLRKSKRKREEHSDYSCSICNFHSEKWFTFEDHAKIVHGIAALFACQITNCFKYYQSKNGLKNYCKTWRIFHVGNVHMLQMDPLHCNHTFRNIPSSHIKNSNARAVIAVLVLSGAKTDISRNAQRTR